MKTKLLNKIKKKYQIRKYVHYQDEHIANGKEILRVYRNVWYGSLFGLEKWEPMTHMWTRSHDPEGLRKLVLATAVFDRIGKFHAKPIGDIDIKQIKSAWRQHYPKVRNSGYEIVWP